MIGVSLLVETARVTLYFFSRCPEKIIISDEKENKYKSIYFKIPANSWC